VTDGITSPESDRVASFASLCIRFGRWDALERLVDAAADGAVLFGGHVVNTSGWTAESFTPGRRWDSPSRPRGDNTPTEGKVRWCRTLAKNPVSVLRSRSRASSRARSGRAAPTQAHSSLSLHV